MRFRAIIQLGGKNATGIPVPPEIVASLGSSKHPPVRVTIGDFTYRSSVASMNGVFMLPLSAERRVSAGVGAGDEVEVEITLDTEPREVEVPPDFAEALAQNVPAQQAFAALSYIEHSAWAKAATDSRFTYPSNLGYPRRA